MSIDIRKGDLMKKDIFKQFESKAITRIDRYLSKGNKIAYVDKKNSGEKKKFSYAYYLELKKALNKHNK